MGNIYNSDMGNIVEVGRTVEGWPIFQAEKAYAEGHSFRPFLLVLMEDGSTKRVYLNEADCDELGIAYRRPAPIELSGKYRLLKQATDIYYGFGEWKPVSYDVREQGSLGLGYFYCENECGSRLMVYEKGDETHHVCPRCEEDKAKELAAKYNTTVEEVMSR